MPKNSDQITMNDVFTYISESQYVYLTTVQDAQPRIRPMVLFFYKGVFYFITFTNDAKVAQIKNNKLIEVLLPIKDELNNQGYIKMTGRAKVCTDADAKYDATYFCYFFDEMYDGADDPDFCLIECSFDAFEYFKPGERHSVKVMS